MSTNSQALGTMQPITLSPIQRVQSADMVSAQSLAGINIPTFNPVAQGVQRNSPINLPLPSSFSFQVASTSSAATSIYLFNTGDEAFNNAVTTGGGGESAAITYTWSDGYAGRNINNLLNSGVNGVLIYGFQVRLTVSGSGSPAALAALNASFVARSMFNNTSNVANIVISADESRSDQDTSVAVATLQPAWNQNKFCQFVFSLYPAATASFVFYLTPDFRK